MRFDLWQTEREKATALECGLKVLRGESLRGGQPTVQMWRPKAIKPYANYRFHNTAQREAWIAQEVENEIGRARKVAERKAMRAGRLEGVTTETVSAGDIFSWSWGYDQTNQNFYQVVERRGRKVVLRELAQETVPGSEGFMSESVLPIKDNFLRKTYQSGRGEVASMTKLIQWTDDGKAYIAMPYGWCDKWDGRPQYASHYA